MADDDSDTPEPPSIINGGIKALMHGLRQRLATPKARAGLFFVLGAITASVVVLLSLVEEPGLSELNPALPRAEGEQVAVVASAWAEAKGPQHIFHWTARDGSLLRAKVNADEYKRYAAAQQQRIDIAKTRLTRETDAWVRGRLRPALTDIEARIVDYGDWMYNWWTAWILLGQAFGWTWQGLLDGEIKNLPNIVHARLIEEIRGQYDRVVLRFEILEPQMQALVDRAVAGVQREILQICGPMEDARQNFVRGQAREIERNVPGTGWVALAKDDATATTLAPTCGTFDAADEVKLTAVLLENRPMSNLDAGVDTVIVRLSRPFATKLISYMVLPVVTTAIAGGIAVPFVGLPAGALAGLLAGGALSALIIGTSASAAVDWLLTRADEALSRKTFEADLRTAVKRAAGTFEARVVRTLGQYVELQYRQLARTAYGGKP